MHTKPAFDRLSQERKNEIIEKAMDLYLAVPYEAVTIRKIVECLNINMATFYRYFETKDDLYLYINVLLSDRCLMTVNEDLILDRIQNMTGLYTPKEEAFLGTFLNIPNEVLRRMYFEGQDSLEEFYRKALTRKKAEGILREDVDVDMIAFMYATAGYNFKLYWDKTGRKQENWIDMKDYFFFTFFKYGIFKDNKGEHQ